METVLPTDTTWFYLCPPVSLLRIYIWSTKLHQSISLASSHEVVLKALEGVLVDEGFKVVSSLASAVRELPSFWLADHSRCSNNSGSFSDKIVEDMRSCFISNRSYKLEKEAMWGSSSNLQ